ncbi:MAG TPA: lysylphosphatidylglycerol synthase transmembrane domain-containing protein [Solirubrobacteraceae bacterium]|nr:lysylphosphatidylglycerol synthase transmembrane domain-containing protein [Solirubrobacteraceae bacterium]
MSPTSARRRRPARSLVLQAVVLAVLLGAVVFVIAGIVPGSGARFDHISAIWIGVEIVVELIACLSYAVLFHGVFSSGAYRIGFVRAAEIALGELGAFVVVPTGAGGPALRIWALLRSGMPFRTQMVRSVIHAAIFNAPYVLAAIVLGTSVALGVGPGHARLIVALAPLGVVFVTLSIAAGAAVLNQRLEGGEPQARWQRIGRDIVHAVPEGVRELPGRLREPSLLLAAIGYWAGDCGVLVVAFHAVHGSAPVGVIVLAYMLGQLGNALPLPGGVGGVEPIMLGVLTASGVNLGLGAAAIILYRFVSLGLQATIGAVAVGALTTALRRSPSTEDADKPPGDTRA